jgi:hypothetical protein
MRGRAAAIWRRALCRLGLHRWHLHGGSAVIDGDAMAIFYTRTCRDCGRSSRKVFGA